MQIACECDCGVCARHGGWKAARPGRAQGGMAGEGEGEGASPVRGDDGTMGRSYHIMYREIEFECVGVRERTSGGLLVVARAPTLSALTPPLPLPLLLIIYI